MLAVNHGNVSRDNLTLVITTSPTPTAPSTELLTAVFLSFQRCCPQLLDCRIIVVFDTFERVAEESRLKKGQATPAASSAFAAYVQNVKDLVLATFNLDDDTNIDNEVDNDEDDKDRRRVVHENHHFAEFGNPMIARNTVQLNITRIGSRITFIEPTRRLGFALAVRSALRLCTTDYVWVHQHDWTLLSPIPVDDIIRVMRASDDIVPIKYICLPSIRLISYAMQSETTRYPVFRDLTAKLTREYCVVDDSGKKREGAEGVPLTPMYLWHDKPHIVLVAHYLTRMFPSRYATRRGEFLEDRIGQKARTQMKAGIDGWRKWATWMYNPDGGKRLCLKHLDGRTWEGVESDRLKKEQCQAMQLAKKMERQKDDEARGEDCDDCTVSDEEDGMAGGLFDDVRP